MHAPQPRSLLSLVIVAGSLSVEAPAAAQDPAPTPTPMAPIPTATATPPPPPPPPPPAVRGKLRVSVQTPHRNRGKRLAVRGDHVHIKGTLRPAVAGQTAILRISRGRKTLKTRRVAIRPDGTFSRRIRVRATGRLTVRASHRATPELAATRSKAARFGVLEPSLRFGSRGTLVRLFQRSLDRMKYPASRTGVFDAATGRAVMAYRKVNGLQRTESPSTGVVKAVLRGRGAYKVRHPKGGHHVEVDISRQFLALVDGDRLVRVYPTSSGAPATPTVLGTYRFYLKTPGTNASGMVYSNYFIRGYAIHGYPSVPAYNASHGCLRIPIPNARNVYDWINLGDRIFVDP